MIPVASLRSLFTAAAVRSSGVPMGVYLLFLSTSRMEKFSVYLERTAVHLLVSHECSYHYGERIVTVQRRKWATINARCIRLGSITGIQWKSGLKGYQGGVDRMWAGSGSGGFLAGHVARLCT
jgi:hypothetical protein